MRFEPRMGAASTTRMARDEGVAGWIMAVLQAENRIATMIRPRSLRDTANGLARAAARAGRRGGGKKGRGAALVGGGFGAPGALRHHVVEEGLDRETVLRPELLELDPHA